MTIRNEVGCADIARDTDALDCLEDEWWLDGLPKGKFDLTMGIDYGGTHRA